MSSKTLKVILLESVKDLGNGGEIAEVARGYAVNYLLPQEKAILATEENMNKIDKIKKDAQKEEKELKEKYEDVLEELGEDTIEIEEKADLESKTLYGSLHAEDIAEILKENDYNIPYEYIDLTKPIKKIGEHEVPVFITEDLQGSFSLVVKGEGEEEESEE